MVSDVITIHVSPDVPWHLIDKKRIRMIKEDAIFVNTSVGHVVDQEALLEELKTGRFYAFMDVFDGLPPKKKLKELRSKVLSTYRAGWYTRDSVARKADILIEKLLTYANGVA